MILRTFTCYLKSVVTIGHIQHNRRASMEGARQGRGGRGRDAIKNIQMGVWKHTFASTRPGWAGQVYGGLGCVQGRYVVD
jgi:hypothetical protein